MEGYGAEAAAVGRQNARAGRVRDAAAESARSAAARPEITALSIVAGRPVWIQSPARKRFASGVSTPGRTASAAGVSESVACRSRTTSVRRT